MTGSNKNKKIVCFDLLKSIVGTGNPYSYNQNTVMVDYDKLEDISIKSIMQYVVDNVNEVLFEGKMDKLASNVKCFISEDSTLFHHNVIKLTFSSKLFNNTSYEPTILYIVTNIRMSIIDGNRLLKEFI